MNQVPAPDTVFPVRPQDQAALALATAAGPHTSSGKAGNGLEPAIEQDTGSVARGVVIGLAIVLPFWLAVAAIWAWIL